MPPLQRRRSDTVDDLLNIPFYVDSIDPVPSPEGSEGTWYRYVVRQGPTNTITGKRSGTREEVSQRVDAMVETLNERRLGKYRPAAKSRPPSKRK
jgi:hypothetical protein